MNRKIMNIAMAVALLFFFTGAAMAADQTPNPDRQYTTRPTEPQGPNDQVTVNPDRGLEGQGQAQGWQKNSAGKNSEDMAEARNDAEDAVNQATKVIREMTSPASTEQTIPRDVLQQAKGIVIIPDVFKAGLLVGGRFGRGVLMTQNNGQWSLPVIVTIGGASIGAQAGVESSDLVMVINNEQAVQKLIQSNNFKVGTDASVAAGSFGAKAKATAGSNADIIAYRGTNGLYAGATLTGSVLDVDKNANAAYYSANKPASQAYFGNESQIAEKVLNADQQGKGREIVQNAPQSAKNLQQAMDKLVSQKSRG